MVRIWECHIHLQLALVEGYMMVSGLVCGQCALVGTYLTVASVLSVQRWMLMLLE